jgi:hypothetical protein
LVKPAQAIKVEHMNEHRLIELTKTERAIAEGLRAIEEQHEILAGRKHCGQDVTLAQQTLKALRQTQQQHVARRKQLFRELEKMRELEKNPAEPTCPTLPGLCLPHGPQLGASKPAAVEHHRQARLGAAGAVGQHSDRTVLSSIRYP